MIIRKVNRIIHKTVLSYHNGASKSMTKKKEKVPVKGENIETEIDVSIEEAYYGNEKKISLRAQNGKMKSFTV